MAMSESQLARTSIVIPAFNEALRLPATLEGLIDQIKNQRMLPLEVAQVIVVDDGSTDSTISEAEKFASRLPHFSVIRSEQNYGKGHAIHVGIEHATCEWILVADADMSTPWTEGPKLFRAALDSNAAVAIASRDLAQSQIRVKQSWVRESMGKTFNTIVRTLTGLSFKDTQCGFKLFLQKPVREFLPKLVVDRFAWDVEFLLYAQAASLAIVEVPVTWEHREQSRVHPLFDGLNMLFTVIILRLKIWRGQVSG